MIDLLLRFKKVLVLYLQKFTGPGALVNAGG
jgi:hypothetical protein